MKPNIKFQHTGLGLHQQQGGWGLKPVSNHIQAKNNRGTWLKITNKKNMIWVSWINYKSIMTYLMPNILEGDASSCVIQSPAWGTLKSEGLLGSMFIWVSDWRIIQSLTKKNETAVKISGKKREHEISAGEKYLQDKTRQRSYSLKAAAYNAWRQNWQSVRVKYNSESFSRKTEFSHHVTRFTEN